VTTALLQDAIGAEDKEWKDIKPARNYMDIKKKAFVEAKKREHQANR